MYMKINTKIINEERENALRISQIINIIKMCSNEQNIAAKNGRARFYLKKS